MLLLMTVNRETPGFSKRFLYLLSTEVLARFMTVSFMVMEQNECNKIFNELLNQGNFPNDTAQKISAVQIATANCFSKSSKRKDMTRGEAAMTIRKLNFMMELVSQGNDVSLHFSCQVAYLTQIPSDERKMLNQ